MNARGRALVASTGNDSELRKTIPITARSGANKAVVMSLGPGRRNMAGLPDLAPGDRLEVTAEVEVTTDCARAGAGCVGNPYGFAPTVGAPAVARPGPRCHRGGRGARAAALRPQARARRPARAPSGAHLYPGRGPNPRSRPTVGLSSKLRQPRPRRPPPSRRTQTCALDRRERARWNGPWRQGQDKCAQAARRPTAAGPAQDDVARAREDPGRPRAAGP